MSDDPSAIPVSAPPGRPAKPEKQEESFFVFLLKLVMIVVVFRSFIFSPFNIPSESMMPRLVNGDYLLAAKWPFGYSKYSMPFSAPVIPGRILGGQPERGDIVIFKAPPANDTDYIKRVIGLPGDQVQMIASQVYLNGKPIPREKSSDFEIAISPNTNCYLPQYESKDGQGNPVCRYPRFKETLPNGKVYYTLDLIASPQDDTAPFVVPEGHLFLMGDNRDNSLDSRFPAIPGQGIGIVPQDNLVGRATVMMFSTDGGAEWVKPWTWFSAARWNRIGGMF